MTLLQLLRWALIVGFFCQILSIIYGVVLLKRFKKEQDRLSGILITFADRSTDIAAAIRGLGMGKD